MVCLKPILITKNLPKNKFPDGLLVPCGKCINCAIQKTNEWALRLEHEQLFSTAQYFITLTYDDKNIPKGYTLRKSDVQKYIKRIRKNVKSKIKYYLCGEYGEKYGRPHYHAIIFTYDCKEWEKIFNETWKKGIVHVGTVTSRSIRYVVGYTDKKILSWLKQDIGCRQLPFRLMSQGFGVDYAYKNAREIIENKHIKIKGKQVSIPRYYRNKLGLGSDDMKIVSDSLLLKKFKKYMKQKKLKKMSSHEWHILYSDMQTQGALNKEARTRLYKKQRLF